MEARIPAPDPFTAPEAEGKCISITDIALKGNPPSRVGSDMN